MKNLNIAIIDLSGKYAKEMGKKGTTSDFTIYNLKQEGCIIAFYHPHAYPDKIQSLLHCINLADYAIWVIGSVDFEFAEIALALWLSGKKGIIVLDGVDEEEVKTFLQKSPMHEWEKLSSPSPADLRQKATAFEEPKRDGKKRALIDACFAVEGVGTVALCKVEGGTIKVHDELELVPSKAIIGIRSIQLQDDDVKEAPAGSRPGFSLKGISAGKIKRGSYFSEKGYAHTFKSGKAEIEISPIVKREIKPGMDVFFSWGLEYCAAKLDIDSVISAKDGRKEVVFSLSSEVAGFLGQEFLIAMPEKKPRIVGKGKFVSFGTDGKS